MTAHFIFDDAPARSSLLRPHDGEEFNRDDAPPADTPLRVLLRDDRGEYSPPFAYLYRAEAEEFYSQRGGLAPVPELAVVGWAIWVRVA
jgi:hypothetical protein